MGAFEYAALDARGRERKGVLEGDSPRQIRQRLRADGLMPLAVEALEQPLEPASGKASAAASGSRRPARRALFGRGLTPAELALVTRQLATLIRAALPVEEALATSARQADKARIKKLLLGVRARVVEGHSLADGLEAFPGVFPDLYRATVAAGEQSGHLAVVLERLADYTEARQQLSQKTQLAMLYPALLTVIASLVVIGLLTYVVPQVVQVFDNIGQQLPWITRALIATSGFLQAQFAWLVLGVAGVAIGFVWLLRREAFRRCWHALLLRLPLLGRLIRGMNAARLARTLSILAASGVPVLEALRIAGQVLGNLPLREAVAQAAERVREGSSLSAALDRAGHFPPMMVHLIASGEASGTLESMLARAADHQERELEGRLALLMGLMEPALILIMGGVVLVIVLAILLPIFDLNQLVK